jgi:hypothetical protein
MKITLALEEDAQGETPPSPQGNIDFSFLPKALVEKCKPFIIRYHELNGFSSLPDILWHPETHKFIEADLTLKRLFKKIYVGARSQEGKRRLGPDCHTHSVHGNSRHRACRLGDALPGGT